MKYILLIVINGQLYLEVPGLTYTDCTDWKFSIMHIWNRGKAEGLATGKIVGYCKPEE